MLELPAAQEIVERREKEAQEPDPDAEFFASLEQDLDASQPASTPAAGGSQKPAPSIPTVKLKPIALAARKGSNDSEGSCVALQPAGCAARACSDGASFLYRADQSKTGEKRKQREPELIAAKKVSVCTVFTCFPVSITAFEEFCRD